MKKIFLIVLLIIGSFGLVACDLEFNFGDPDIDENPNPTPDPDPNPNPEPEPDPTPIVKNDMEYVKLTSALYDEFFDINSKVIIEIDIEESELAQIQSDYNYYNSFGSKSPIYRKADVTIIVNDVEYFFEEVGIRMKGNTSRRSFYDEDNGLYDMIHYKLSFSETFDSSRYDVPQVWDDAARKIRKDRLFAGMEKLDLKWNKSLDETYTREYWANSMFEEFGVLVPKISPVNIKIDYRGSMENLGVFFAIETIDNRFLEKRLAEKHLGGDLYKVGWTNFGGELTNRTLSSIGIEDEDNAQFYTYDLKTNRNTSTHSNLTNLIDTLNNSYDFSSVVNLGYYLNFEAISYLVGNPDDMRNNFNNYYIYFLADTNQAIFIPYDYDRSLGITHEWDPTGNAMTSFGPYTNRMSIDAGNSQAQINPLITKTITRGGNSELILQYRDIIIAGKNSKYFDVDEFYKAYEINKEKYQNLTKSTISSLENINVSFNKSETRNMNISEYLTKKDQTITNLIDSYQ